MDHTAGENGPDDIAADDDRAVSMPAPIVAHRKGYYYEVKAGRRYAWCSCGRSANQPFCDGSHQGSGFTALVFTAERDDDVIFCGCKHTATGPFCDGAHSNLPGGYLEDDPESLGNQAVALATPKASDAVVPLDGACFVFSTSRAKLRSHGNLRWCPVITPALGSQFQSQFYAELDGDGPIVSADGRHTVLFIAEGSGALEIGDRRFETLPRTGFYIRPDEAWRLASHGKDPIKVFVSNGPGAESLVFLEGMVERFGSEFPDRRADVDPTQRIALAERRHQILIDRRHGSSVMTQFIATIPPSKAEPHRHLYEEALIFLSGAGVVWTERTKARVERGDVLFLPRKQVHSVQCIGDEGLDIAGVIFPGDNPAINY